MTTFFETCQWRRISVVVLMSLSSQKNPKIMTAIVLPLLFAIPSTAFLSAFRSFGRSSPCTIATASLVASSLSTSSSEPALCRPSTSARAVHALSSLTSADTGVSIPEFLNQDEYMAYLEQVSALPNGFSVGVANGEFIPEEAPSMGKMRIRGTLIYLTEGPTDNWAGVFTKNKVCSLRNELDWSFASCVRSCVSDRHFSSLVLQ